MVKRLLQSASKNLKKRGALEISFGWLFAIIAGIAIIFIAIYFSSKLVHSSQETVSAETGKEIEILLNPLETSFESSQITSMTIPTETRINNICDDSGTYGRQGVRLDQMSFGKWVETSTNVYFTNKYIFSDSVAEGKKFYIFSKPFSFPFKVADLIYLIPSSKTYCFADAPSFILNELSNLNQSIIETSNCNDKSIKVCFNSAGCAVNVNLNSKTVTKNKTKVYYSGLDNDYSLMYAAIFSDKNIYECQAKRLMLRLNKIAKLYKEKAISVQKAGCDDTISNYLNEFEILSEIYSNSENLEEIAIKAASIQDTNNAGECMVW
jgi:hypothetical protein